MSMRREPESPGRPRERDHPGWIDLSGLKDRVDLATVATLVLGPPAGRKGQPNGRRLWWHCPFHDDPNPSFCVTPGKRTWHCFGCAASGDAVGLLMRINKCRFTEAIRWLGELSGISVAPAKGRGGEPAGPHWTKPKARWPDRSRGSHNPSPNPPPARTPVSMAITARSSGMTLTAAGARWWNKAHEPLWSADGREALHYLHRRGLTDPTIERARLGFTKWSVSQITSWLLRTFCRRR